MNQFNIDFNTYEDLYYEALYLCRSSMFSDDHEKISETILKLIDIFSQEISNSIDPILIKTFIEESYCNPDFSISMLADRFKVSIAYMSYLTKKELNFGFSDYHWKLRFEKAKDLLKNTDLSVDSISNDVGYLNTASFRRKFKQETGLSPNDYRRKAKQAIQ